MTDQPADQNQENGEDENLENEGDRQGGDEEKAVRPDYVPENFWDADKGAVRLEDFGKSYSELRKKLSTRTDDLEKKIREELDGQKPKTPEAYEFTLPKDSNFEPDESFKVIDVDHPAAKKAVDFAKARGLSQDDFSQMVGIFVEAMSGDAPAQDFEGEMKKLGEKAPERVERIVNWFDGNLSKESAAALKDTALSARVVLALEEVIGRSAGMANFVVEETAQGSEVLTEAKLGEMMADPAYYEDSDKGRALQKKVQEGFAKLYKR